MTADEFTNAQERLARSRRQFCDRLGISRKTGDRYALGRAPIPLTVALAIAALEAGLSPAGTSDASTDDAGPEKRKKKA